MHLDALRKTAHRGKEDGMHWRTKCTIAECIDWNRSIVGYSYQDMSRHHHDVLQAYTRQNTIDPVKNKLNQNEDHSNNDEIHYTPLRLMPSLRAVKYEKQERMNHWSRWQLAIRASQMKNCPAQSRFSYSTPQCDCVIIRSANNEQTRLYGIDCPVVVLYSNKTARHAWTCLRCGLTFRKSVISYLWPRRSESVDRLALQE